MVIIMYVTTPTTHLFTAQSLNKLCLFSLMLYACIIGNFEGTKFCIFLLIGKFIFGKLSMCILNQNGCLVLYSIIKCMHSLHQVVVYWKEENFERSLLFLHDYYCIAVFHLEISSSLHAQYWCPKISECDVLSIVLLLLTVRGHQ